MELPRNPDQTKATAASVNPVPPTVRSTSPQTDSTGPEDRPAGSRRAGRRKEAFRPNPSARLLDPCREVLRFHHFALRTEPSYVQWIRRYVVFHGKRHPKDMGKNEINTFLSHPATDRTVAAATQNQALHALLVSVRGKALPPSR